MSIKVSIIMPSLNVEKYIEEAVRSAMRQTLNEIEIICIDAGSDDGTWEILTRLANFDRRIVLCHSNIKSYGYQVNMGIDMAKGEYIAILETDDYVSPEMYERLYYAAVQYDCDYVKGDYLAYWTQNNGKRFFYKKRNFVQDDLYGKVIKPKNHISIAMEDWYLWTGIYKKEFLKASNIRLSETSGAAFQDIGFIHKTTVSAKRALYLNDTGYRYCMDRENASSNSGKKLKYSFQEFSRLVQLLLAEGKADYTTETLLYYRMAKSFVCSYGRPPKDDINMPYEERNKYYLWFKERLQNALKRNIIEPENMHSAIWKRLKEILISEEFYCNQARQWGNEIRERIGMPGEFSIVIFGCGYYGYHAYKWLTQEGYSIGSFMDNNKTLWGSQINGNIIETPEKAMIWEKQGNTPKYLIANELHYNEIRNQLLALGVRDGNIGIYQEYG